MLSRFTARDGRISPRLFPIRITFFSIHTAGLFKFVRTFLERLLLTTPTKSSEFSKTSKSPKEVYEENVRTHVGRFSDFEGL